MKTYDVEVHVDYVFTVEADSVEEAESMAEAKYYTSSDIGNVVGSTIISIKEDD